MEQKTLELLTELYVYVASLPWRDKQFVRSEAVRNAAQDHIVLHTLKEIIKLNKDTKNA